MTGYGLRYTGGFYDSDGNTITVEIHQKDYASLAESITLKADNPIVISKPSGDLLTHIFGTGCKINIVNNGSFLRYSNLFGTPEREHYVLVKKTVGAVVITLFEGFVLPQMYEQSLQTNALITIPANDQLSSLKNKKPQILLGTNFYIKLIDLIKEIVWSTGLENPIYIKNGIFNEFYETTWSSTKTLFSEGYIDKMLFMESEGNPMNSYDVLESILKTFGSRIFYRNGKWFIERVKNQSDLDTYRIYNFNGTEAAIKNTYAAVELSDHYLINGSGNMSYEAGVKDYELTLNIEPYDNLVNSVIDPIQNVDALYQLTFGGGTVDVFSFPIPNRYEWTHNGNETSNTFVIDNYNYRDTNIESNGVSFTVKSGHPDNDVRPKNIAVSSKFLVDISPNEDWKIPNLKVNYKYSFKGYTLNDSTEYRFRYALRYKAAGALYSGFKYIKLDGNGDTIIEQSASDVPVRFVTKVMTGAEIKQSESKSLVTISDLFQLNQVYSTIKADVGNIVEIILDVFAVERGSGGSWYVINPTKIGDFLVTTESDIDHNVIDASIESDYNTKIDLALDIFDYTNLNIKNNVFFYDSVTSTYKTSLYWRDRGYDYKRLLHLMYLSDIIQNYNQNRYKLSVDVRLKNLNSIGFNEVYTYQHIIKESTPINMICVGYDYNVKANVYRLELQEWVDDDGYTLLDDWDLTDPTTLTVNPNSFTAPSFSVPIGFQISSNTDWTINNSNDWITFSVSSGVGDKYVLAWIADLPNPVIQRQGTFTVNTNDSSVSVTLTVNQSDIYDENYYE